MLIIKQVGLVPIMRHDLAQMLFLFYIFIFAWNQEKIILYIIYINLTCPDNIIKLLHGGCFP